MVEVAKCPTPPAVPAETAVAQDRVQVSSQPVARLAVQVAAIDLAVDFVVGVVRIPTPTAIAAETAVGFALSLLVYH